MNRHVDILSEKYGLTPSLTLKCTRTRSRVHSPTRVKIDDAIMAMIGGEKDTCVVT